MERIRIGKISAAQGLRGEVRLFHDSGDEEALRRLSSLFLRSGGRETEYRIEWMRMQKRTPILKLSGIEDRGAAEAVKDADVFALLNESRPDEEGAYLVSDLIGLEVFNDENRDIAYGRILSVIDNPAHDIIEIETEGEVRLLPFIDTFIREVDTTAGRVHIVPPEGWLD